MVTSEIHAYDEASARASEPRATDVALGGIASVRSLSRLDRGLVTSKLPAGQAALTWVVVRDDVGLEQLRGAWSRLTDVCDASLFRTPEWIECWRTTIAPDVQPRVMTGWDAQGRLRVCWPLGLRRCGGRFASWRSLEPMGAAVVSGDRLEPVADVLGYEPALVAQLQQLARGDADVVRCHELTAGDALVAALQASCESARARMCDARALPVIRLPQNWDRYAARLGPKLAGQLARTERKVARTAGLTWRVNDDGGSLESALEGFMAVHQDRWQARGRMGNFTGSLGDFVRAFGHVAHRRGWLRLHRLCDGPRTVAALLAFHHGRRAYYYQSGWDPAIAAMSPGSLCIARAIRVAMDEEMRTFDFLRGDEAYKRRWCTSVDETVACEIAASRTGRMVMVSLNAKESVKRTVGSRGWAALRRWTGRDVA